MLRMQHVGGQNVEEKNVRERLLESAARCFLEDDYKSVTTRSIARNAGTTPAMISYYFNSKSGLFEAVIKHYFASIYESLDALGENSSLEEGLKESWLRYFEVMTDKPELPRLMVRALVYKDVPGTEHLVDNVLAGKMTNFCRGLQNFQHQGAIRGGISARRLWVLCAAIAMMPVVFDEIVERLLPGKKETELPEIAVLAAQIISRGLAK